MVPRPESTPRPARREASEAEAKALASPLRLRILRACLHEPHTNKEIANALEKDPATTLHHVRTLVDTGFLAALPARRGTRGAREIPYTATGKSWRHPQPGLGPVMLETFLDEVALVAPESVDTTRLGLRLTHDERRELDARLRALLDEFRTRSSSTGEAWSLFVALHPDPNA